MPKYQETELFELDSLAQVDAFCRTLREMKERAPESLRFLVAVTATREVEIRKTVSGGNGLSSLAENLNAIDRAVRAEIPEVREVQERIKARALRESNYKKRKRFARVP